MNGKEESIVPKCVGRNPRKGYIVQTIDNYVERDY